MTAEDPATDVGLLTRIASIEDKIRSVCDLIPISTWGFSADVHEKLRQRKHRIVNQQLTASLNDRRLVITEEKKTLSNSKKQQVARSVGGVCRRVSEVIDLLGASSVKDVQPKKVFDDSFHNIDALRESALSQVSLPARPKSEENGIKKEKEQSKKLEKKPPPGTAKTAESESSDESDEEEAPAPQKKSAPRNSAKQPQEEVSSSAGNTAVVESDSDSDDDDTTDEEENTVPKQKPHKRPAPVSEEIEAKKSKFTVEPVECATKEQSLDVLEQRELAIRKLQEKLKAMKANRQGKKKASADPSAALKFEQERKLKRRMSKMKMKQRRAEEKKQKVDGKAKVKSEVKQETSKDEAVSFSKFDFLVKSDGKKKRLSTSEKKKKFTGKDYKSLINKVEKREEKLEKLREAAPEQAAEFEDDIKWSRAVSKAQGVKVKDNIELLKEGLKRKEKLKEKKKENWSKREMNVEREKLKKQEKRKENLQKRIDDKKKNKLKVLRKKGRVL
ncbi:surfeit locus protein 6 [Ancylostoma ceylanicum]|uniref:Surfeit locus protein 6 n=1 Tax=Ancylostoma ceylanicum TaxID=53326 RepID=A0A0D6M8M1_9BILA|nr:surfeit locus protein 6 [Ancylostoma ceylanicum]